MGLFQRREYKNNKNIVKKQIKNGKLVLINKGKYWRWSYNKNPKL